MFKASVYIFLSGESLEGFSPVANGSVISDISRVGGAERVTASSVHTVEGAWPGMWQAGRRSCNVWQPQFEKRLFVHLGEQKHS